MPSEKFKGMGAVKAGEVWAEGISSEAGSNQGGSAPCPTMPTEFGTWE